ncbi:MAG: macro domain-containing protein [Pseudomonadota bacterium]
MQHVRLIQGDITQAKVDAILNAANPGMLGGGGVDGAIHRAAGPALLDACRRIDPVGGVRCPIGKARITSAGELSARHVIHTVGPRYEIDPEPEALLASAYRCSFQLAIENRCRHIAAPAISCGVYGYPLQPAADIAFRVCGETAFLDVQIDFYLFSAEILDVWQRRLDAVG